MNYIFLVSVQHTGTWFIIDLLEKAGYTLFLCQNMTTIVELKLDENTVMQTHAPPRPTGAEKKKHLVFEDIKKLYQHIKQNGSCLMVVPLRDPLASLITRRQRHPDLSSRYIIAGFVIMAKRYAKFNPFYFPIDLYEDVEERKFLLTELENHIEKKIEQKDVIAAEWQPKNTCGSYQLKNSYFAKDVERIKQELPEWSYLVKYRKILQPFFESFGYRNLLWFK